MRILLRIPEIAFWRRLTRDEVSEEDAELREVLIRYGLRVAAAFVVLFGLVFFTFWWSGAAVRFGAARAANRVVPTWKIVGTVKSAVTHNPIPWAVVADDFVGKPPFYQTDASYSGEFELLTLAEPHRIRISAPGYRTAMVGVGRTWFLWLPKGEERRNIELFPE
jgi:hypothetical protein